LFFESFIFVFPLLQNLRVEFYFIKEVGNCQVFFVAICKVFSFLKSAKTCQFALQSNFISKHLE